MMADDLTPNDELVTAKPAQQKVRRLRDRHQEVVRQTRPESCHAGQKIGRHPTLDDYDNR